MEGFASWAMWQCCKHNFSNNYQKQRREQMIDFPPRCCMISLCSSGGDRLFPVITSWSRFPSS